MFPVSFTSTNLTGIAKMQKNNVKAKIPNDYFKQKRLPTRGSLINAPESRRATSVQNGRYAPGLKCCRLHDVSCRTSRKVPPSAVGLLPEKIL